MADTHRTERQLMRQRGAGLRDVNNVDFGLKFGTQDSREDRQLMRQRGAGNRNINNVDFGFSFPTPNPSRRSSRTPQAAARSSVRSSRTPGSRNGRQPSAPKSLRKTSVERPTISSRLQNRSATPEPILREQPNSSKRRRISKGIEGSKLGGIVVNLPSRRSSLANPGFSIAEDGITENERAQAEGASAKASGNIAKRRPFLLQPPESPLFVPQDEGKENYNADTPSQEWAIKSGRLRPVFDDQGMHSLPPTTPVLNNSILESIESGGQVEHVLRNKVTSRNPEVANPFEGIIRDPTETERRSATSSSSAAAGGIEDVTAARTKPMKRKKQKRKSVILRAKTRRSLEKRPSIVPTPENIMIRTAPDGDIAEDDQDEEESERPEEDAEHEPDASYSKKPRAPLWRQLNTKITQKRRARLSVSPSPELYKDANEDGDESYVEEDGSPEPITPALKKKKTTTRNVRQGAGARSRREQGNNSNRKTFPITTYRITNAFALPTITEENEFSDGVNETTSAPPATFSNRAQPNAVDVLSQICRETIQTAIDNLKKDASANSARTETKQKRTALEAFGENLDQRLFEMSEAVEHRMTLEARLRKSKREKAELQARWLEVRRQRDNIALKADTIRRQNWETEEEGKRQWEISELAHQTDLALDSNPSEHADLEFTLKEVADQVSSVGSQGGILGRIKSFNKRLEKIAATLETHQA